MNSAFAYASATTITVTTDATLKYSVGDKLKLTQTTGGTKYFTITTVAATLLTITGGTSYTLNNEAITAPYYSKAETPLAYPQMFTYTPVWSAPTPPVISNGTINGRFTLRGRTVVGQIYIVMGGSTTFGTGEYTFSLPLTAATATVHYSVTGRAFDSGTAYYTGIGDIAPTGTTFSVFTNCWGYRLVANRTTHLGKHR